MREVRFEEVVQIVDGHPTGDAKGIGVDGLDLGLLAIVFVGDLTDDLLQQVLDGDQPRRRSVLVQHDGNVHSPLLHLPQEVRHLLRVGHEVRLAHDLVQGDVRLAGDQVTQQILRIDEALDLVDRVAVDGDPRVTVPQDQVKEVL